MKIVNPEVRNICEPFLTHIEKIGRVCYQSDGTQKKTSPEDFVSRLIQNRHLSILEHYRFVFQLPDSFESYLPRMWHLPHLKFKIFNNQYYIGGSARGFYEAAINSPNSIFLQAIIVKLSNKYDFLNLFNFPKTYQISEEIRNCSENLITEFDQTDEILDELDLNWHSVFFITDRGVSHELVRHRTASFAQESTRYCNYSHQRFGKEISVVRPSFLIDVNENDPKFKNWQKAMIAAERQYFNLLEDGVSAQDARSVLPNSLKTAIVVTCWDLDWSHILDLRYKGLTGTPHPDIRLLMEKFIKINKWSERLI